MAFSSPVTLPLRSVEQMLIPTLPCIGYAPIVWAHRYLSLLTVKLIRNFRVEVQKKMKKRQKNKKQQQNKSLRTTKKTENTSFSGRFSKNQHPRPLSQSGNRQEKQPRASADPSAKKRSTKKNPRTASRPGIFLYNCNNYACSQAFSW